MLQKVADEMNKVRFTEDDVAIFLGEYLSEPKASTFFDAPQRALTMAPFAKRAVKNGISLSRKSQMLYRGRHVFINGESFQVNAADKAVLSRLANQRQLDGPEVASASQDVMEAFLTWYEDGWLHLN